AGLAELALAEAPPPVQCLLLCTPALQIDTEEHIGPGQQAGWVRFSWSVDCESTHDDAHHRGRVHQSAHLARVSGTAGRGWLRGNSDSVRSNTPPDDVNYTRPLLRFILRGDRSARCCTVRRSYAVRMARAIAA